MTIKGIDSYLPRKAIIAGLLLLVGLFSSLAFLAHRADTVAQVREEQQVAHGMSGWSRELADRIAGQTGWDDAVQNLAIKYSPEWAHSNVGQFLHQLVGIDRVVVLDAHDQPIYASYRGDDAPVDSYKLLKDGAAPLLVRVRETERLRGPIRGMPPFHTMVSSPIDATGIRLVDGEPYLIVVSLVQPDFGKVQAPARSAVVVSGQALGPTFIEKFGDRFLLAGLHIHPWEGAAGDPNEAHIPLRDGDGRAVARMDWTPQQPGLDLLKTVIPPVLVVLSILGIWAALLFKRGREATEALLASESRAKHMAYHDAVTGLPNAQAFQDRIVQALAHRTRGGGAVGIVAIKLDRFREVTESFGRQAGDELIIEMARRLSAMCRSDEVVARLGAAEFAILQGDAQPHQMSGTGERILRLLSGPVELSSGRVFVTASVGLTHCRDANADPGEIMRQADLAVDRAEADGGGRACFFEPEMDMALRARKSLEHDLREALANESFTMVYQPQANLRGVVTGVEALIRWSHPVRGPVSPAFFIPVAEECGLIEEIGAYTLRQAFRDSRRWPQMTVAVNVSAAQLRNPQFPDLVGRMLAEADVQAEQFELEITEGVLLADDDSTHDTLHKLRAMGFRLALDDFGTGYSSLGYLRRYPVDKIKIDRSFVVNLGIERDAEAVVGAIVKLARALNLKVIAEGVETEEQQMGLERAGCRHIQGYLFSRPLTAELVDHLVRARVTS